MFARGLNNNYILIYYVRIILRLANVAFSITAVTQLPQMERALLCVSPINAHTETGAQTLTILTLKLYDFDQAQRMSLLCFSVVSVLGPRHVKFQMQLLIRIP